MLELLELGGFQRIPMGPTAGQAGRRTDGRTGRQMDRHLCQPAEGELRPARSLLLLRIDRGVGDSSLLICGASLSPRLAALTVSTSMTPTLTSSLLDFDLQCLTRDSAGACTVSVPLRLASRGSISSFIYRLIVLDYEAMFLRQPALCVGALMFIITNFYLCYLHSSLG